MTSTQCPGCGESDDLTGRAVDGDIEVTCGRCGAVWHRGEPRCRVCGRPGGVLAEQRMTRHPRGTLLAVIGVHQVRVCPVCDAEVAEEARTRHRPLPDGYRSRFVHGEPARAPAPTNPVRMPPKKRRRGPTYVGPVASTPASKPSGPRDPTVRQATEAFLSDSDDPGHSLIMVMLGSHLGPATRLSALSLDPDDLAGFVERTWGSGGNRGAAVTTLRAAFGYWAERDWIATNPAADLV